MKEAIIGIEKLYNLLKERNENAISILEDAKKRSDTVALMETESSERSKDLDARETAVRVIEDVVALGEENKETLKEIAAERVQLNIEKDAFVAYSESTKKIDTRDRTGLNLAMNDNAKMTEKLKEGLADLEKRKKNIRKEVVDEFNKKLFGGIKI